MEAEGAAEEEREVEILIAEVVAGREGEFRQAVAYITAVGLAPLNTLDDVAVFVVDQPFAVG